MARNGQQPGNYGWLSGPRKGKAVEPGLGLAFPAITPFEDLSDRAEEPLAGLSRVLDSALDGFVEGDNTYQITSDLFFGLNAFFREHPDANTIAAGKRNVAGHPVLAWVHECPFTRHSYRKPSGYAGDARLLDFIYGHPSAEPALAGTSRRGREIMTHNIDSPAAAAVRTRKNIIASRIADVAGRRHGARILAVACGHLREAELLAADTVRSLGEFVAVDQDRQSLEEAARYQGRIPSLVTRQASIIELMKNRKLTGFDFIYAAGLYDYLSDKLARKLTENLFNRLSPGGRLLVANFLPGIRDAGYMEFFMDWSLIYRTPDEIMGFAERVGDSEAARRSFFIEPNRNVGYLEITRRC